MQLRLCFTATSRGWLESFKNKKKEKKKRENMTLVNIISLISLAWTHLEIRSLQQ